MKRWRCTICGYEHEGMTPPDLCPICSVGPELFERMDAVAASKSLSLPDRPPKTLEEVRAVARTKLAGICGVYPGCDGKPDRICQREAYGAPILMGGVGSGSSFRANVEALAQPRLRMQVVGDHFEPDTSTMLLGRMLSMPIMGASTSGVSSYNDAISEAVFCRASVHGCIDAGTISWRGETSFYTPDSHPGLDAIEGAGGVGIQIFKPRSQDALKGLIERAEAMGCIAVGVDLDGCGSTNMARAGQPVYRKSVADLRDLVSSTSLPFITKGVMTPDDAEACVEAGVTAVVVSNHGGRVLDYTPGVAEVLPSIASRVGQHVVLLADGGVRTGFDVLKLLALGARSVLIGRDLIRAAIGGGRAGVRMHMEHLQRTLGRAMLMTGCPTVGDIGPNVIV